MTALTFPGFLPCRIWMPLNSGRANLKPGATMPYMDAIKPAIGEQRESTGLQWRSGPHQDQNKSSGNVRPACCLLNFRSISPVLWGPVCILPSGLSPWILQYTESWPFYVPHPTQNAPFRGLPHFKEKLSAAGFPSKHSLQISSPLFSSAHRVHRVTVCFLQS